MHSFDRLNEFYVGLLKTKLVHLVGWMGDEDRQLVLS